SVEAQLLSLVKWGLCLEFGERSRISRGAEARWGSLIPSLVGIGRTCQSPFSSGSRRGGAGGRRWGESCLVGGDSAFEYVRREKHEGYSIIGFSQWVSRRASGNAD